MSDQRALRARYADMKTARFATVVEKCGKPEVHLTLVTPAKDRELQAAKKAHRILTVMQENVGATADHGEVGFHPGKGRQFLIFPKSLKSFESTRIVGIKYDLVSSPLIQKSKRAPRVKPPKRAKPKTRTHRSKPESSEALSNIVAFQPKHEEEDDEAITQLKKQVRRAMAALEDGKQVAAFNLLKRIVGD